MNMKNNMKRNQNQQDNNNYNEDKYRGCWNCIFHNDADCFVNNCIFEQKNTIYLRCPQWVLDENK